jgi:hypothetical protein
VYLLYSYVYLLYLMCICCILCIFVVSYVYLLYFLCVFVVPYVYLLYYVCIAVLTLDAGLLARSQYPEGLAPGHLDTSFSWFRCVYKRMLRGFSSFQVATTCLSCSPLDSVSGRSYDRPPRHRFFLASLCLQANAEMVPKFPSCYYMPLM